MEKDHSRSLTEIMSELYYNVTSDNNTQGDVVLVSKDREKFRAHQIVLVAQSTMLESVLHKCCFHEDQVIVLDHYSSLVVSSFLSFCYTGILKIEESSLEDLISLCNEFSIAPNIVEVIKKNNLEIGEGTVDNFKNSSVGEANVESIFFDENDFDANEIKEEEYLNEAREDNYETLEKNHSLEKLNNPRELPILNKAISRLPASRKFNLANLKEEQEKFKKRLQDAINSCKNGNNSIRKV